jgi:acyl-CoA thioesterase I
MKKKLIVLKMLSALIIAGLMSACIDSGGGGGGSSGPQTVLVIGDSISGGTNYSGVPPWPSLMAGMVPEWTIINRSTPGQTMSGGRSKVAGLLAQYQPDSLVIFYGSNNAIQGSVTSFEPDLAATIQAGKDAGVKKILVCTVPYMYGPRVIYDGGVDVVNAGVRSASSALGAKVADINREFGTTSEALFPDGLHPNLEGQQIIAVSVRERL